MHAIIIFNVYSRLSVVIYNYMHAWRYVKCLTYIVLIILYSYSSASISWISTPVWPWWKNGFNRIPSSSGSRCNLPKLESLQATYTKLLHWTTQLLKEMSWNERNKEKQRPVHKIILHISVKNVLKSVYTWYPYCSEWSIIVGKKYNTGFVVRISQVRLFGILDLFLNMMSKRNTTSLWGRGRVAVLRFDNRLTRRWCSFDVMHQYSVSCDSNLFNHASYLNQ